MKTYCVLALCAILGFTACQKDTDYARPGSDVSSDVSLSGKVEDAPEGKPEDKNITSAEAKCIEIASTSWLAGYGEFKPIRPADLAEDLGFEKGDVRSPIPGGEYKIEGQGQGFADGMTRCTTNLKLTFNTRTNNVYGQLTMKFVDGRSIVHNIDGKAIASVDRTALILEAQVHDAYVHMGTDVLDLNQGKIRLALPLKPEGWFEANVYTTGKFCYTEKL